MLPSYEELAIIDRNILKDLKEDWEKLKGESITNKGSEFENFTAHFFSAVKDFSIRGVRVNAMSGSNKKEHDYDVFFLNESQLFSEFGKYLLTECKYVEEEIGYPDISKFFHKLHNKRCKCGILLAKSDVVDENLNSTIRSVYDNDDIVILTFNKEDIQNVIDQKENLATLLRNKYEQVRFRLKKLA